MTAPFLAAERLERTLGDPGDPHSRMPATVTLSDDEYERFPERACAALHAWRFTRYFVPAREGGALTSFAEALLLLRVVSRRDLTCAIALGQTYLGALPVWLGGDATQRERAAALIGAGAAFAFALTEREHGSDVLANDVVAEAVAGGFRLDGEKWLINNGTRARGLTVFARTAQSGPRGYSLFFVDVAALPPDSYERTPKIRTHGIRGADISGVRFRSAFVPSGALIGAPGGGLEIALKGLMITRMMCAGFALGAADTALRLALRFAAQRRLYGTTVAELADPRRTVAECFADLLGADALTTAAVRAAHADPRSLCLSSAIVKFTVPALVESIVDRCGTVLGARSYLRDVAPWSLFQKLARDVRVVGLFDGSAGVNLQLIVTQLPGLARRAQQAPDAALDARLDAIFDARRDVPAFDGSRIELSARGHDDVMAGFRAATAALAAHGDDASAQAAVLAGRLVAAADDLYAEVRTFTTQAQRVSAAAFACARRYGYLHAAAALVHTFVAQRSAGDRAADTAEGLSASVVAVALAGLAARAGLAHVSLPEAFYAEVAAVAANYERLERLFSVTPVRVTDAAAVSPLVHEAVSV